MADKSANPPCARSCGLRSPYLYCGPLSQRLSHTDHVSLTVEKPATQFGNTLAGVVALHTRDAIDGHERRAIVVEEFDATAAQKRGGGVDVVDGYGELRECS